jgi:hypothetical protein
MENQKIKETIKVSNGKPIYCLQVEQGEAKMQIYIRNGEIYFESCNYSFDNYMDAMARRNAELNKIITRFNMAKIKDVNSATPETIEQALKETIKICTFDEKNPLHSSILRNTGTFNNDKESVARKVYKDMAKGYKNFVKNSYRSPNQLFKIAIGIFVTLPITCNVLNWVYPRFMDICFPKLAGAKANQKAREKEVK